MTMTPFERCSRTLHPTKESRFTLGNTSMMLRRASTACLIKVSAFWKYECATPVLRRDMESWAGCVAGTLEEDTYRSLLQAAGFVDIVIEVTRRYSLDKIAASGATASITALTQRAARGR
jgi:hypothetical protein